ncbi:cytochrome c [Chitinophaga pendula]|uniref:c-type cytochrome n=1 Tax=Chitinophaga TaxID=79328 RepID=UPI000BB0C847|nr:MULTISPECIES: cytochrome c [Chitinophaga]ASZ12232.1 hypothetical protein CK934_15320 [Chitinophaga sp. MD30]UCJ04735.1 cytochrome c [Chitinophaga pendula]
MYKWFSFSRAICVIPLLLLVLLLRPAFCIPKKGIYGRGASTTSVAEPEGGAALYRRYCTRCHGEDGTKGMWGARNLQRSQLGDAAILEQIMRGGGPMPAFRKRMSMEEIQSIADYIKRLRKPM